MCSLYKRLDINHDHQVTIAEMKTLLLGIQVQADGEISDNLLDNIMGQLDISGNQTIEEAEFIRVVTKWLCEARNSLSKNDHNPLSCFTSKPQAVNVCYKKIKQYIFSFVIGERSFSEHFYNHYVFK